MVVLSDLDPEAVDRFFSYARERHAIYLRRRAGLPGPWTSDPVMSRYRITNVFRELDKTTTWFRKNVRDPLRDSPDVLLATVIFRWFNTIRSGETLFMQPDLLSGLTPFEAYLREEDPSVLAAALRRQGQPWVTGAYMIRSPEGMDKLDGIVHCIDLFSKTGYHIPGDPPLLLSDEPLRFEWLGAAAAMLACRRSGASWHQETLWSWLKQHYGLGPFLAYELVTDLRHTALLDGAPDILTWACAGPGARRGANLLIRGVGRARKGRLDKSTPDEALDVMRILLECSRDAGFWPQACAENFRGFLGYSQNCDYAAEYQREGSWPAWEMREPEMWLCEYAKMERTRLGFGRPRGTYP